MSQNYPLKLRDSDYEPCNIICWLLVLHGAQTFQARSVFASRIDSRPLQLGWSSADLLFYQLQPISVVNKHKIEQCNPSCWPGLFCYLFYRLRLSVPIFTAWSFKRDQLFIFLFEEYQKLFASENLPSNHGRATMKERRERLKTTTNKSTRKSWLGTKSKQWWGKEKDGTCRRSMKIKWDATINI